jgi:hypothetical protein
MQYRLVEAAASDVDWLENLVELSTKIFSRRLGAAGMKRDIKDILAACLSRGHISIIEVGGSRVGMIQIFDEPKQSKWQKYRFDVRIRTEARRNCITGHYRDGSQLQETGFGKGGP